MELLPVSDNNYLMDEKKKRYPGNKRKKGQGRKRVLSPSFLRPIILTTKMPARCVKLHSPI